MTESSPSPDQGDEARPRASGSNPDPLGPEAGIAPEVSRRVSSILDAVEREAGRLRGEATDEAQRYLDYSRRRADELVAERQRRIAALSDEIVSKAEAVVGRLDEAAPVRQGFDNLVRALGDAAERLAQEAEEGAHRFQAPAFHDEEVQNYTPPTPAPPPPPEPPAPAPEPVESYQPYQPYQPQQPPAYEQQPPDYEQQPPAYEQQPSYGQDYGEPQGSYPPDPQAPGEEWQGVDDARLVGIQMAAAGRTRGQVREHLHSQLGIGDARAILDEIFGPGSPEDARVPWTAFPR